MKSPVLLDKTGLFLDLLSSGFSNGVLSLFSLNRLTSEEDTRNQILLIG